MMKTGPDIQRTSQRDHRQLDDVNGESGGCLGGNAYFFAVTANADIVGPRAGPLKEADTQAVKAYGSLRNEYYTMLILVQSRNRTEQGPYHILHRGTSCGKTWGAHEADQKTKNQKPSIVIDQS